MTAILYHKFRDVRDIENAHPLIDALWNLVDAKQEDVMDVKRVKSMSLNMTVAPALSNNLIDFDTPHFVPFPAERLDEYHIPESTKDSGRRHGHCRLSAREGQGAHKGPKKVGCNGVRGLLGSLITGIFHYAFFEDRSQKRAKKDKGPMRPVS